MFTVVAIQETGATAVATIFKLKVIVAVWEDNRCIEINQVRVIGCIPLDGAYTVRVMADATGGSVITDM